MLIDKKVQALYKKLQFDVQDLFKSEDYLINEFVKKESTHQLYLTLEKQQVTEVYNEIKKVVRQIDNTLEVHTQTLLAKALKSLDALEKKILKAEKRKFETHVGQIKKIKALLFPLDELQERVENVMPYYANFGKEFIRILYEHSMIFQQQFCVLSEEDN
jgi:uncharacterized protein YllA (UPF0747 family)